MKLSRLLELIGSGSVLLGVGVLMVALGVAFGFAQLTHIPYWASLSGFGLFAIMVGYVLFDRGTEETEERVNKLPIMEALHSPWLIVGASVTGGLLLAWLTHRRRERLRVAETVIAAPIEPAHVPEQPEPSIAQEDHTSGVSHFIGEQLRTLGSIASSTAVDMAIKAFDIPSVQRLVGELLESEPAPSPLAEPMWNNSPEGAFVDANCCDARSIHNNGVENIGSS